MSARLRNMKGIGLVELMISMALGLVTVGVIGWVYIGTVQTYRTHDSLSRLQESGRYAFELISRDLRMAGATGCSVSDSTSVINSTAWYSYLLTRPVQSVERDNVANTVTQYSDALGVLRADVSKEHIVQSHAGTTFTLTAAHTMASGDFVVATDCVHAAVFQSIANGSTTVGHGAGGTPGNSPTALGAGGGGYAYPQGTRLYRMHAVQYFVKNNAAGVPSLFRRRMVAGAEQDEELVEGVEDMQITYAIDTSTPVDGIADYVSPSPYLTAAQVLSTSAISGTADQRWARVVSVRVNLLLRSVEDRVIPTAQSYTFNGTTTTAADLRLRKVLTHVVKLRNR